MFEQAPVADKELTYEEALMYCHFCNHNGYTDWRMPTKDEFIIMNADGIWCWDTSDVNGLDHGAGATFHAIPVRTVEHFLKMNGESFTCQCGCNVFHYWYDTPLGVEWYACNGCDLTYESEIGCSK